jgi:hypothetical protein
MAMNGGQHLTLPQILTMEDQCQNDPVALSRATWSRLQFHARNGQQFLAARGWDEEEISEIVIGIDDRGGICMSTGIAASGKSNRPSHIPARAAVSAWMFRPQPREYFWGWENHWFMLDGMPARAPKGWVQPIPGVLQGNGPVPETCERWYDHLFRGHAQPCQFYGQGLCRYAHALPSIPG